MSGEVRAIIARNNQLLVIHRKKPGQEYYTLPGGGVERGENLEQSLARELAEETGVHVSNPRLVFVEHARGQYDTQHIFLCEYVKGEPRLHPNSGEALMNKGGRNIYTPMWLPIAKIPEVPLVSPGLKEALLDAFKGGFPLKSQNIY